MKRVKKEAEQPMSARKPIGAMVPTKVRLRDDFLAGPHDWRSLIGYRIAGNMNGELLGSDVLAVPQDQTGRLFTQGSWGWHQLREDQVIRI